jgi:hypothetical protein
MLRLTASLFVNLAEVPFALNRFLTLKNKS